MQIFNLTSTGVTSARYTRVMDWEYIRCPINKSHPLFGKRLSNLSIKLRAKSQKDVYFTMNFDCLISDKTLNVLNNCGIGGFETKPVDIVNKDIKSKYYELIPTGWGGVAPQKSGIKLLRYCRGCNMAIYSGLKRPVYLFNKKTWDKSDIFIIWPLVRYYFITDKLAEILKSNKLSGYTLIPIERMDINDGYGVGALDEYFPEKRALELKYKLIYR